MTVSGIARFLGLLASVLVVPLLGAGVATVLRWHADATFAADIERSLPLGAPQEGHAYNMATLRERIEGHAAPLLIRLLGMPRFARLVIGMGLKRVDPVRAAWVSGLIGGQDAGRMIAAWRAAMAFDSRPRLGEIRCPTLVLAGAADTAVPMHHGRQLHEGIAHSRLVAIDGANHAMIWTDPDRFASEVDAFLES